MDHLIIRLLPSGLAQWGLYRAGSRLAVGEEAEAPDSMADAIPYSPGVPRQVVAIVPGIDVFMTHAEVPVKQRRHLQRILPFLLEDQMAEDVGLLHFAAGAPKAGDTKLAVAGVRTALMEQWLGALEKAGLAPVMMIPETWLIPEVADAWTLLMEGDRAWLRVSPAEAFSLDKAMLADVFSVIPAGEAVAVECSLCGVGQMDVSLQLQKSHALPFRFITHASLFDVFAKSFLQGGGVAPLNLLQGAFAPKQNRAASMAAWRKLGMTGLGWAAAMCVLTLVETGFYTYRISQLQAQANAIYQSQFPEDTKIVDPVQQMKAHLHVASSTGGLLPLLSTAAQGWNTQGDVQVQSLNYQNEQQTLTVNVTAQSIDAVNELAQALDTAGLSTKVVSIISGKDGVSGQLSIRGAP